MTTRDASRFWFGEGLAWIRAHPGAWLRLMVKKAVVLWEAYEVPDNLDYYVYRETAPVLRLPLPGFGLVAPLGRLDLPALALGSAAGMAAGDEVFVLGHGGRAHALKAEIFARREFAGPWEYVLDEALFTTPPHPEWSGAALLGEDGRLAGIGSLFVQEASGGDVVKGNMFVPVELFTAIQADLLRYGRRSGLPRPWLGMYTDEGAEGLVVTGLAPGGPAEKAGVAPGDLVVEVAGDRVAGLAELFRKVWRRGPAGTTIRLTLARGGAPLAVDVATIARADSLKKPRLQ